MSKPRVLIVDYDMGNLLNVERAVVRAGLDAIVSSDKSLVPSADCVILPGIGAFGDAMERLRALDLVGALRARAESGKPLVGVCLGLQLLFETSDEFGAHEGLSLLRGRVVRFAGKSASGKTYKVPHIGWTPVERADLPWEKTPLAGQADRVPMYFVHSFYVAPLDASCVLAKSTYAETTFASAVRKDNVFAFQFHPERSGPLGLAMYEKIAELSGAPVSRAATAQI